MNARRKGVTKAVREKIGLLNIAVVVSTLSSPASLERVLLSLKNQSLLPVEVVVVSQKEPMRASEIIERTYPSARMVISECGLSKARNVGIRALESNWDIVALPDDDIEYAQDAFKIAAENFTTDIGALCGLVLPEDKNLASRVAFGNSCVAVTDKNVWKTTIEAGYFLSRRMINVIGYYDEDLGLGTKTPWRSGEGTDMLLRGLKHGFRVQYRPDISMIEVSDSVKQLTHGVGRLRDYARGTGRVYGLRYGVRGRIKLLVWSVFRLLIRGVASRGQSAKADWAILLGRMEGLMGFTFPSLLTRPLQHHSGY